MDIAIDEQFMAKAIEKAKQGVLQGQTPFGACITKNGKVITCDHNVVFATTDITAHAEIHAIRNACKILNTIDLSQCTIYSTCEPCPMCFAGCHWSKISKIVFGAKIEDAQRFGFSELSISNRSMKEIGKSPIVIVENVLRDENIALFEYWSQQPTKKTY